MSSNNNFKNHKMVFDRVWEKTNEVCEGPLMSYIAKNVPWMTSYRAHLLLTGFNGSNGEEILKPTIRDYVRREILKRN